MTIEVLSGLLGLILVGQLLVVLAVMYPLACLIKRLSLY